jgi:hypothetical protein
MFFADAVPDSLPVSTNKGAMGCHAKVGFWNNYRDPVDHGSVYPETVAANFSRTM